MNFGDKTFTAYVVDQVGYTAVFRKRDDAEKYALQELWNGADDLRIREAEIPAEFLNDLDAAADWAAEFV